MGSQGGDGCDDNEKHALHHPLVREKSMYSLTLNEVQNQLGDTGKPLRSMNLDELLKFVYTAEANQSTLMDTTHPTFSLTTSLRKKTVDEVWRDLQGSKDNNNKEKKCEEEEREPTLGEMTLENLLVKAGVVFEPCSSTTTTRVVVDPKVVTQQFPQHRPWMQYPQTQYQQGLMGIYMTGQNMAQTLHTRSSVSCNGHADGDVALSSYVRRGRKRGSSEEMVDKSYERKQKRMIKNRESAARSRARKQVGIILFLLMLCYSILVNFFLA